MDVSEIVAFNPDKGIKRIFKDLSTVKSDKNMKFDSQKDLNNIKPEEIAKYLENSDDVEIDVFDENALKRLILLFEKRIYKNQELRIKFNDTPEKFLESELNLHNVIQQMHIISTTPKLYYILVELNSINSIINLLSHENSDISIAILSLLQEMTDLSVSDGILEDYESLESFNTFIEAMLNTQIIQCIVQNMERLDESIKEESAGIYNSLAIIENLSEIYPNICKEGNPQEELLLWLIKRLKLKLPFDSNKLYTSEILAIFLQNHEGNRLHLGNLGGIDVLLRQLAIFKKHDPETSEEYEFLFNLFDCLSLCLLDPQNQENFLEGEGLQLMNLMLREKKQSRCGAIKILNHALMKSKVIACSENDVIENDISNRCCNKFVEILGLRTIFPIFMKTPNLTKNKVGLSKFETEEHIISIIASLSKGCTGQAKQRFLTKFIENDLSKVDRLVEFHFSYLSKILKSDNELELQKQKMIDEGEIIDESMEEEFYLKRLENGLYTQQMIDYIMIEISASGDPSIKERIMQILLLRRGSIKTIRDIILEYAGNLGENDKDFSQTYQQHILYLIDKF